LRVRDLLFEQVAATFRLALTKEEWPRTHYSFTPLSRSAFVITETELKLIAALAIIGLSSQ